jgi:hypothetical protein
MDFIPGLYTIIQECRAIAEWFSNKSLTEQDKPTKHAIKRSRILNRIKEKFDNHLEEIGKDQTISVRKIYEMNMDKQMPIMLKHCVVAVQRNLKSEGKVKSFIGAHNICFATFERYNLISKRGLPTTRGIIRERFHRSGKDPVRNGLSRGAKTEKYNSLFKDVFKKTIR